MTYELRYTPEAKYGLEKVFRSGLKNLAEKTLLQLSINPFQGKRLTGDLMGIYSIRITRRFRALYTVSKNSNTVFIIDVAHRREVYE